MPHTLNEVAKVMVLLSFNAKPVMAAPAIGLTPMLPRIAVVPVVEIPDFVRMTKLAADLRFTVRRAARGAAPPPSANATAGKLNPTRMASAAIEALL